MGHNMKDFEEAEDQIERVIRCIKHSKSQRAKTLTPKEIKYRISKISTYYGTDFDVEWRQEQKSCFAFKKLPPTEKLPPKFQYLILKMILLCI